MKEQRYRINTGGIGTDRLVLALISDFHNGDAAAVSEILKDCRPDLIAVTGDLFHGRRPDRESDLFTGQKNVMPLIRCCVELAPTYFSLGNHEWVVSAANLAELEQEGVVVLDNRWVRHDRRIRDGIRSEDGRQFSGGKGRQNSDGTRDGDDRRIRSGQRGGDGARSLVVGGLTSAIVTDYRAFKARYGGEELYSGRVWRKEWKPLPTKADWLDGFEAQEGFRILLCHHPEYWCLREPMLRERRIDLVLSGHAHGGQIRLFGRGLYAPGQGLLPAYTGGIFEGPHGRMAVSRGTANTGGWIPRLFNPPEVVIIDLSPEPSCPTSA